MKRTALKLGLVFCALPLAACGGESTDPPRPGPVGPVASNAQEAWPEKPSAVPTITARQIAQACVLQAECLPPEQGFDRTTLRGLVELCSFDAAFSAERAIPLSGFAKRNERAEFFVQCTLQAKDCTETAACATERADDIHCQEDGCRVFGDSKYTVTCSGDVATLASANGTFQRDCARAYAQCAPESPSGCTDRHFSACDDAGLQSGDRCDGDVRLGCDGQNQVSYRDCTRLGGTCQTSDRGQCVYADADPRCDGDAKASTQCDGEQLSLCVGHSWVTVSAPTICPL